MIHIDGDMSAIIEIGSPGSEKYYKDGKEYFPIKNSKKQYLNNLTEVLEIIQVFRSMDQIQECFGFNAGISGRYSLFTNSS